MSFSQKDKEKAMIACGRCCSVCHKPQGLKMEAHHIVPKSKGGEDTYENLIPLCFSCHSDAGHYNDKHPKGIKLTSSELQKHRDNWYKKVEEESVSMQQNHGIGILYKLEHTRDLVRCINGVEQFATDYPPECKKDYQLFSEFFGLVNNSDIMQECSEFYLIEQFDPLVKKITEQGYVILLGNDNSYGKHKFKTAFVFIRTNEDYNKNKISF